MVVCGGCGVAIWGDFEGLCEECFNFIQTMKLDEEKRLDAIEFAKANGWEDELLGYTIELVEEKAPEPRVCLTDDEVEAVIRIYLATALWSETDEDGLPLEDTYSVDDFDTESITVAREHVTTFLGMVSGSDIRAYVRALGRGRIGHDLWLTANGHGAGFWDRGLGDVGERLSDAARELGSNLYRGDDGLHLCEPAPAGWRRGDEKRISCEECARNTAYIIATFGEPEDGLAVIVCPQCGRDVAPGELMHVTGPIVPESITVNTNKGPVPVRLSPARGGAWRVFNGGFYAGTVSWDERGYVVTSPTVNTWQMSRHATLSDAVSDCIERTGRAM